MEKKVGKPHLFYAKQIENKNIEDVLNRAWLIDLSYINANGDLLKQAQYAGTVIQVAAERRYNS
jgi:hypothetical protein